MPNRLTEIFATFFYAGKFPFAPGSFASLAGLLIAVILQQNVALYIWTFVIITIIGFAVSGKMEEIVKEKDPSCVVIDEVSGAMIAFFLLPLKFSVLITAYFLFRAFDMFKIYPVNRLERLDGSAGVMLDDIFAGLYTNITMHIAIRWAGII